MSFKTFKDLQEERIAMADIAQEQLAKHERKSPKRLIIDLSDELHGEIKDRAFIKKISMKDWVTRAINILINQEKQYE